MEDYLTNMIISIGADHAGFESDEPDDYPDHAVLVADDVRSGKAEWGILACVLVPGARITRSMVAQEAVEAFLGAQFSGEERRLRRLNKVRKIDQNEFR